MRVKRLCTFIYIVHVTCTKSNSVHGFFGGHRNEISLPDRLRRAAVAIAVAHRARACMVLGTELSTTAAYVICISVAGTVLTQ